MLRPVAVTQRQFARYRGVISHDLFDEVHALADNLRGKRVLHINSTASRGGVAEMLISSITLLKDLGIDAQWQTFTEVTPDFYNVTKAIHNGLQGATLKMTAKQWQIYEDFNRKLAKSLRPQDWDFVFVHDHQPAAALSFLDDKAGSQWLWRSHTDTSNLNPAYIKRFLGYLEHYDGAFFTMAGYCPKDFHPKHLVFSPPAIDPFSAKNQPLPLPEARAIVRTFGIDTRRPLMVQLSRPDPWKDLPGVVEAWQLARQKIPGLQLALVSNFSLSDPQAEAIIAKVKDMTKDQPDVHLILNLEDPRGLRAFQVAATVVLQKSLAEGFGLTVSEAMWAKRPVIGGDVGGIRLQIIQGKNGYLVDSVEECAKRIVELVQKPDKGRVMGHFGHEHVREHFLMPRMIRDELKLMSKMSK